MDASMNESLNGFIEERKEDCIPLIPNAFFNEWDAQEFKQGYKLLGKQKRKCSTDKKALENDDYAPLGHSGRGPKIGPGIGLGTNSSVLGNRDINSPYPYQYSPADYEKKQSRSKKYGENSPLINISP